MAAFSSKSNRATVGLDIEADSIAATEVRVNGKVEIAGYGVAPLPPGLFREGEVVDPDALGSLIKDLFSANKLSRNVRVGVANQRLAVRILQLPAIEDREELETAIRFRAQDSIPMPLEQAVLDWEVIGYSQGENGEPRLEVVVAAARRDMIDRLLATVRAAGLRPVGIDVAAFGLIRALGGLPGPEAVASYEERMSTAEQAAAAEAESHVPSRLYCYLGDVTNLAVARGTTCLFTRMASFGVEGMAQRLAERQQLTLEHARQWLHHVGLKAPLNEIEGEEAHIQAARAVLEEGIVRLADELRVSVEYYGAQENAVQLEGVVACGPGAMISGLVDQLQAQLGYPFSTASPAALSHLDAATAARLTLAYGLALES